MVSDTRRRLQLIQRRLTLQPVRVVLWVLLAAISLCGGRSAFAQGTGPGLIVKIFTATSLGPAELPDYARGEVFVIGKSQWEKHREGEDGVTIQRPGDDYLRSYPVRLGSASIPVTDLLAMKPSNPEKDVFTLLLRAQVGSEWINSWWTFSYAEWQRNWDSPLVQYVYIYPQLDLWTERDNKYNVADGVDKQVFILEPEVDIAGRLIVHADRDPVILVHGLHGEDGYWNQIPQQLRTLGHDAWQFYYPGDQNIRLSAGFLAQALSIVLEKYPGRKANLVGHSMGGLVTRAYLEGLGLLAVDEQISIPSGDVVPFQNNVRKWVSLGTPHHGIYPVAQFVQGRYDNSPHCDIEKGIKDLFREDYRAEPAYKQLALGSRFMWDLNQTPFPPDLSPDRDLLSIIGTETPAISWLSECLVTDSLNDGAIDLISASLLDHGIPLVTLSKNHGSIVGGSFPLSLPNENRDTSNLSNILDRFFRDRDYNTGKEGVRIVRPGQDPYAGRTTKRRAGLLVRYVDKNDKPVLADLQLTDPANPNGVLPPLTAWNQNDSAAVSVPTGPPLAYALNADLVSVYAIGVRLGSDSRRTFTLTANARNQSIELQSGHFKELTVCEDTTPLHVEPDPPQLTSTGPDEITVTWKTNRLATSEVCYGVTNKLESQQVDRQLVTEHNIRLTNLVPYQAYALQVLSVSECGGLARSQLINFTPGESRQPPPSHPLVTATTLVIDVSGSMGDLWRGGIKLESAKTAATQFINMLERESQVGNLSHQAALVVFSTDAALKVPRTTDYEQARRGIAALGAIDRTNIGAGLTVANNELANAPLDAKRIIILLSDGMTNTGLPPDEILTGPVKDAVDAGTCIYTVGFGDPGDLDENLLQRIAQATGCGQYYYAPDAFKLEDVYVLLRHKSAGTNVQEFSGLVAQGQTTPPEQIAVPPNQGELHVTLNWPGSRLDLLLSDPQSRQVDSTYPGATLFTDQPPVYAIIRNPLAGTWQAQVYGADVPEDTTAYNLVASTRGTPPTPPAPPVGGGSVWTPVRPGGLGPAIVLLTLLAGIGVALLVVATSRHQVVPIPPGSPPPPPMPFGTLQVTTPGQPPRTVPLGRLPCTIGRQAGCDLVLSDPQVSRTHARIARQDAAFIVEDLGSTNGTFVNGQRVHHHVLRSGDEIQIGQTRLRLNPAEAISLGYR